VLNGTTTRKTFGLLNFYHFLCTQISKQFILCFMYFHIGLLLMKDKQKKKNPKEQVSTWYKTRKQKSKVVRSITGFAMKLWISSSWKNLNCHIARISPLNEDELSSLKITCPQWYIIRCNICLYLLTIFSDLLSSISSGSKGIVQFYTQSVCHLQSIWTMHCEMNRDSMKQFVIINIPLLQTMATDHILQFGFWIFAEVAEQKTQANKLCKFIIWHKVVDKPCKPHQLFTRKVLSKLDAWPKDGKTPKLFGEHFTTNTIARKWVPGK